MADRHPDKNLIALGIQQPWAELILRGVKTIEVRSLHTRQRGTIYIYASKRPSNRPAADEAVQKHAIEIDALPKGLILGTVDLVDSRPCAKADAERACVPPADLEGRFGWQLENPQRFDEPLTVRFLPYGVWFYPFQRRNRQLH
jgi:hypothetical protein